MILSGLFWIIACTIYIIYESHKEDKILTKNTLKGIVIISVVIILPCAIAYLVFGDRAAKILSVLLFVVPGICLAAYGVFSSISTEHQISKHKADEQASPEDRRRQTELECTPVRELCNKLNLTYDDICEGQSHSNIVSLAVAEIMRKENRKYTGYDLRYSEYAKRFKGFLDGTLETISQRIASLELIYATNLEKFETIVGHKINNVDPPFCYNNNALEILKEIAIYDILIYEEYYFTNEQICYMTEFKKAVDRIKSLSTMSRVDFERECGSKISDEQAVNRFELIVLLLKKEGWFNKLNGKTIMQSKTFYLSDVNTRNLVPYDFLSSEINPTIAQLLK